jgi:hypothetical protein
MFLPLKFNDVVINYIPIVGWMFNCDFFNNENKNDVFPTRISPINITVLWKKSTFVFWLVHQINILLYEFIRLFSNGYILYYFL